LETLIKLHRVEIIRQDLIINLKTVQGNLFTLGTTFGPELDVIVENVISLDAAINRCSGCHHSEEIASKLHNLKNLIEDYKGAISVFITTSANPERVKRLKEAAVDIGDILLNKAQEMTYIAHKRLQQKTQKALKEVSIIRYILFFSLLGTMLIGFVVAKGLTTEIVSPIKKLSEAARKLKSGVFGYTVRIDDRTELGELANAFNEMSLSIKKGHEQTLNYMQKLKGLHNLTLGLHMVSKESELYNELIQGLSEIVLAKKYVLYLKRNDHYEAVSSVENDEQTMSFISRFPHCEIDRLYEESGKRAVISYDNDSVSHVILPESLKGYNSLCIMWITERDHLVGFLLIADVEKGEISEDDIRLLSIIVNNFSVAMENISLYKDLMIQMNKLKEAQEQLIQAAKLAAIGELAANIAHEINNPLTTILGYAELLKEEEEIGSIKRDLDVIESESLRAREIVQQLLEFSKKKPLQIESVNIDSLLDEIKRLVLPKLREKQIKLIEEKSPIPAIEADRNQLKQVFLNLINNALQAMSTSGTLKIVTGQKDEMVFVEISDNGTGIPDDVLPRIFEPFFTTKKEKGTGLGLPISYRIVEKHGGRIEVKSRLNVGTTFRVYLPIKVPEDKRMLSV
ncbi:MAG: HAMP domain-containing protein, partial [Nitrospirae bacterium]